MVLFSVTIEKVEEPPGNRAVDNCSWVSLDRKPQVKLPAVVGVQMMVASSITPVRLLLNVITLSTKQARSGLDEISVPEALALWNFQLEDEMCSVLVLGGGVLSSFSLSQPVTSTTAKSESRTGQRESCFFIIMDFKLKYFLFC